MGEVSERCLVSYAFIKPIFVIPSNKKHKFKKNKFYNAIAYEDTFLLL